MTPRMPCRQPVRPSNLSYGIFSPLSLVERARVFRCRRPAGHRGDCTMHPATPTKPLRPIKVATLEYADNIDPPRTLTLLPDDRDPPGQLRDLSRGIT